MLYGTITGFKNAPVGVVKIQEFILVIVFVIFPQKSQLRLKVFKVPGILLNYDSFLTNSQSISSTLSSNQELTLERTFRPEVILKSKSRRSAWVVLKIMSGKKSTISYPVQDPLPRSHPRFIPTWYLDWIPRNSIFSYLSLYWNFWRKTCSSNRRLEKTSNWKVSSWKV